jgi:hypothetical protein
VNVVVSGYFVGLPMAGFFWHAASYVVGFRDAGHQVWYLEDSTDHPSSFDFERMASDPECRYGVRRLAEEMERIGLGDRWAYHHVPTGRVDGLGREAMLDVVARADVFVNVSMTTPMRPEYLRIPHRLAIDTDPVFTQLQHRTGSEMLDQHTRLFSFGRPPFPGQRDGDEWVPTRQPVVTRLWPATPAPADGPFTTVTSWSAYPGMTYRGHEYGSKAVTLRAFADLPRRTSATLAIVLGGGGPSASTLLREGGWVVLEPFGRSVLVDDYQRFVAGSAGEIGFAKHGYVAARSGWFSDRTCCYLASGRAAVVQDTGWSEWLPSGEGLLRFDTMAEAASGLAEVAADPVRHGLAARALVAEHFEAAQVCSALLDAL